MKKKLWLSGLAAGILSAGLLGVLAQTGTGVQGPGVQGGGGGSPPSGSAFSTQYNNGGVLGGTGPGTSGHVLTSRGAALSPTFQAVVAPGSTVPSTVQGDTLFASATDTLAALTKDTNATRYLANTGTNNNPAWAQVNLANGVTGVLSNTNMCTSGTFTATFQTGFTTDATQPFQWSKCGSIVVLRMTGSLSGTSDNAATATTGTDLPASIRPVTNLVVTSSLGATDNSVATAACLQLQSTGIIAYAVATTATGACSTGGWATTGTKAISNSSTSLRTVTYSVD